MYTTLSFHADTLSSNYMYSLYFVFLWRCLCVRKKTMCTICILATFCGKTLAVRQIYWIGEEFDPYTISQPAIWIRIFRIAFSIYCHTDLIMKSMHDSGKNRWKTIEKTVLLFIHEVQSHIKWYIFHLGERTCFVSIYLHKSD